MVRVFLLFAVFLTSLGLSAQLQEGVMIYRKGKPKLVGQIITDGRMVNTAGDTILYDPEEVYHIRRFDGVLMYSSGRYHQTTGIYGQGELSIGLDESEHVNAAFRIGKRFTKDLSFGFGVGFHSSSHSFTIPALGLQEPLFFDATTTSLSLDGRYYVGDWWIRPYVMGELGYGFATSTEWDNFETSRGGLNAQYGLGAQFASRRNTRYFVEFRQYFQKFSFESVQSENPLDPYYEVDIWFKHVNMVLGLRFK